MVWKCTRNIPKVCLCFFSPSFACILAQVKARSFRVICIGTEPGDESFSSRKYTICDGYYATLPRSHLRGWRVHSPSVRMIVDWQLLAIGLPWELPLLKRMAWHVCGSQDHFPASVSHTPLHFRVCIPGGPTYLLELFMFISMLWVT